MISPASNKKSGWTNEDLGATGAWLINTYRKYAGNSTEAPQETSTPIGTEAPQETSTPIGTEAPQETSIPVGTEVPQQTSVPSSSKKDIETLKVKVASKRTVTGKAVKPSIKIMDGTTVLREGIDYVLSYSRNKKVGKATIKVTGLTNYTGVKRVTFKIVPKKPIAVKMKSSKKNTITITYKKKSGITGYQIEYSKNKKFKNKKVITTTKTKKTIKKLTVSKYYVRVRAYKTVGKTKYYSDYTTRKLVKVK